MEAIDLAAPLDFTRDFYPESAPQTAAALLKAVEADFAGFDQYGEGGAVAALEQKMATLLGKEDAVMVPTGTLANHLAIRALVRNRSGFVLAQDDSHLARDCGSALSRLSGIPLQVVGNTRAGISAAQVEAAAARGAGGKVPERLAVVAMESPMRRRFGEAIDPSRVAESCAAARACGAALHLDGARLLFEAAARGCTPRSLADPFDTVYVSIWKSFGGGGGAILAGSHEHLQGVRDDRRRLGGAPASQWMLASLALARCEGIVARMEAVFAQAEALREAFRGRGMELRELPGGTHIQLLGCEAPAVEELIAAGVRLPAFDSALGGYPLRMNLSLIPAGGPTV